MGTISILQNSPSRNSQKCAITISTTQSPGALRYFYQVMQIALPQLHQGHILKKKLRGTSLLQMNAKIPSDDEEVQSHTQERVIQIHEEGASPRQMIRGPEQFTDTAASICCDDECQLVCQFRIICGSVMSFGIGFILVMTAAVGSLTYEEDYPQHDIIPSDVRWIMLYVGLSMLCPCSSVFLLHGLAKMIIDIENIIHERSHIVQFAPHAANELHHHFTTPSPTVSEVELRLEGWKQQVPDLFARYGKPFQWRQRCALCGDGVADYLVEETECIQFLDEQISVLENDECKEDKDRNEVRTGIATQCCHKVMCEDCATSIFAHNHRCPFCHDENTFPEPMPSPRLFS